MNINHVRQKDFDNDGTSECIGLTVSEITIFQEAENDVNLLTGNYEASNYNFQMIFQPHLPFLLLTEYTFALSLQIPEDFLKKFSRYNFDGFCLGKFARLKSIHKSKRIHLGSNVFTLLGV